MKLAFCLYKYFPYGGLERDFLRIARVCKNRGHDIHVYTMHWEGEPEIDFHMHLLNILAKQNHTRCYAFSKQIKDHLKANQYDVVIGFNKMPDLDIYYAADMCYQARIHENRYFFHRFLPRYRQLIALEKAVFMQGKPTKILLISPEQQTAYMRYYQTETNRFHLLPPGITKDRIAPLHTHHIRDTMRKAYQLADEHRLVLMIGSGFKTKGLDRTIIALASLPENLKKCCQLFVIGQDNPRYYQRLAKRFSIENQIRFLGGRDDVPTFLLAADLLIHPAYHENTGTVLLEAIASGLPVLTTDVCGYAHFINEAKAGIVLTSPFQQLELNGALQNMLSSSTQKWRQNGLSFAKQADIYSLPEKATDFIESVRKNRETLSTRSY